MSNENDIQECRETPKKPPLLSWFVTREEPDKDYLPDLKTQWAQLTTIGRIKFIIGALIGAALFFAALYMVYLLLSAMAG